MPLVIPPDSATHESLVLDGLALNNEDIFVLEAFAFNPAPKRQRWIQGEDADGSALAEPSRSENATATMTLRVVPQGTMDSALAQIGKIADKLYEAEQQPDGIPLVWTPATGTKTATAYVLSGEITDLPFTPESGYWVYAPLLTVRFDCKPFMYGAEILNFVTAVTNSNPIQTITLPAVPGDVPALGRLVVTDAATQSRRHVEWGLEWRHYNAATSLIVDSDDMVTTGFGGVGSTRTGAYDPNAAGNNVITATLTTAAQSICGTGVLSHVGGFRVKARVFLSTSVATGSAISVRLTWQEGDGPFRSNTWTAATITNGASGWYELDLGMIAVPDKTLGTQKWIGKVEAFSQTVGDTIDVDYLVLIPTEAYGKGRAPAIIETLSAFGARDEFDQTAGNLNGKTLPVGGTWATSGADATDLTVETAGHTATRATINDTSGKLAIPGATTYTDVVAQVDCKTTHPASIHRLIVRYVDAANYVKVEWSSLTEFLIQKVVANVFTQLAYKQVIGKVASTFYSVRLFATAGGQVGAAIFDQGGQPSSWTITASDPVLATGGALATGKVGFMDVNFSSFACTRNYDNFWAGAATPQVAIYSGRSAEIRSDSAIRQDSTGTYYGPIPSHRGAHFFVPPAGDENRTSRVLVKARRNDIDTAADANVTDSTTVAVHLTPRYSTVPR